MNCPIPVHVYPLPRRLLSDASHAQVDTTSEQAPSAEDVVTACVGPGHVKTPGQRLEYTDVMIEGVNSRIPAGRHATPMEIASALSRLASDQSGYTIGQQFSADGGELAGGTAVACRTEAPPIG